MASSSSSSSVVPRKRGWTYDVYISFRGEDTRNNFVDHLYAALVQKGIHVFKDDVLFGAGQSISEELVKAIKESRFAIVVFSKNYANSSWCLEELSKIMECQNQMSQKVFPVFYHVDPSDVRKQNGDFAKAFETHEQKFKGEMDKVNKWRDALNAAANLSSHHILPDNGGEASCIFKILKVILADIHPRGASRENHLIGIEPRIDALYSSVVPTRKGGWTNDVFLSFSARDTGNNFSDHLYAALVKELRVFRHGYAGQTISEDVVKAIKESKFVVVVFSKNYANSSLCLEELSTIMECHDQMGQRVLPVFYHVHLSDIRGQKRDFATAFKKHEDKFRGEVDKVKKLRDALTAATNLPGLHILPDNTGESAFVKEIVEQTLANVEIRERKIGKLFFSEKEIGKGSNGTIVLEGMYDIRPVAVKRVVKSHHDVASKEIQNLIDSDHLPNIVRYYGVEDDRDFVYIALERCICSLHELILSQTNPTVQLQQLTLKVGSFKLREPNGHPSPELLKVMRDTVTGLAHLHKLRIIHRDLKPQNVLICKYSSISAKVSDMGISKCLPADMSCLTSATGNGSSGWQAPEILRQEPQTHAVDLFSFGCLLFFCITGGRHPFGDMHERDTNILKNINDLSSLVDNIPEAFDLVSNLIHPDPESRPNAAEVYHHPLFWDPDTRLSFFRDASDCVELEIRVPGSNLLNALESIGTVAFGSEWDGELDSTLLDDLTTGRHRKYEFDKVRDLLRVIRNKFNHYRDLRKDVQDVLGDIPTGFEGYFRSRFPKLLMEVYKVLKQYCREEESLKKYYKKTLD